MLVNIVGSFVRKKLTYLGTYLHTCACSYRQIMNLAL